METMMSEYGKDYGVIDDLESIKYAPTEERWFVPQFCVTCKHWDREHVLDSYATCAKLVYGHYGWRLDNREAVRGSAAIVRTHAEFSCAYWDERNWSE